MSERPQSAGELVIRFVSELRKHPAYAEHQLAVSPAQLAAMKRMGELAFKYPLWITRERVIIDGYARKEFADSLGISTLACVELDVGEEEALRLILSSHGRSSGWIDFNRIRLASGLKEIVRIRARANQQAGGQLKALSNLTEAHVRKEIAKAAHVSEGNVAKFDQLRNSDPEILNALASGEIRINRAWLWRGLTGQEQREALRLYRIKRDLEHPTRTLASKHHANSSFESCNLLNKADLEELIQGVCSM